MNKGGLGMETRQYCTLAECFELVAKMRPEDLREFPRYVVAHPTKRVTALRGVSSNSELLAAFSAANSAEQY